MNIDDFMNRSFSKELPEQALPDLEQALRNTNIGIKHRAMDVLLGEFRDYAFHIFMKSVNDENWLTRYETLWALGELGDKKATDMLVKSLSDPERKVYSIAAKILTEFDWTPSSFDEKLSYYFAMGNFGEIVKLKDMALPLLMEKLKEMPHNWDLVSKSAWVLGKIGDPSSVESLMELLRFNNLRVTVRVVEALGNIGDLRALEPLMKLININDHELQEEVLKSLGKLKSREASAVIIPCLKSHNPEVRIAAADALGETGDEKAFEPLCELIRHDKNVEIIRIAINSLGKIKHPDTVSFLSDLMNYASEELHEAVINALSFQSWPEALDIFIRTSVSDIPQVRFLSARALGKTGNYNALPVLIKMLEDEDWRVTVEAIKALGRIGHRDAIPYLNNILSHKRSYLRILTVKALENIGSEAIEYIKKGLEDKHNYVRMLSSLALDNLGFVPENDGERFAYYFAGRDYEKLISCDDALSVLIKGLGDNYNIIRESVEYFILSLETDRGEEILVKALKSSDPKVKSSALKLLGEIGRGRDIILEALRDKNSSVRRTAVKTIRLFEPSEDIMAALTLSLNDNDQGVRQLAEKNFNELKKIMSSPGKRICRKKAKRIKPPEPPMPEIHMYEYSYEEMIKLDEGGETSQPEGKNVMELCNKKTEDYFPEKYVNVVLFEPKIPPNTGNIARLCAGTGAKLYLVGNIGFSLRDRFLKRAGLDYWHLVRMYYYPSMEDLYRENPEGRFFYFSSNVSKSYTSVRYETGDFLVFGSERVGLPKDMLKEENSLSIPIWKEARSFNLSTSVAIAVYEALRQLNHNWA